MHKDYLHQCHHKYLCKQVSGSSTTNPMCPFSFYPTATPLVMGASIGMTTIS